MTHPAAVRPEIRLILLAGRDPCSVEAVAALLAEPLDWNLAIAVADREKAAAALWRRLSSLPDKVIPPAVAEPLRLRAILSEFWMQRFEDSLESVLAILTREGIPAVLLKGAALGVTLYQSLANRPLRDLDILIRPEEARKAWDLLTEAGWKPVGRGGASQDFYGAHHHLPPLEDGTEGPRIEIHTHLVAQARFRLGPDVLWKESREIAFRDRPAQVLPPEVQLLHTCIHFAWSDTMAHGWWTCFRDLEVQMSAGLADLDRFIQLARQTGAQSCAYWSLRLARQYGQVPVPPDLLNSLRPPGVGALQSMLERHFARVAFLGTPPCPSVRLNRLLWELGIRPRWSGHGSCRPWDSTARWIADRESRRGEATGPPGRHRPRARAALSYLSSLLGEIKKT